MPITVEPILEWLSLVDSSGIYLSPKVMAEAYPQSLGSVEAARRRRARAAWEEWQEAVDERDPHLAELHHAWVALVLEEVLEYRGDLLQDVEDDSPEWTHTTYDSGEAFCPNWIVGRVGDAPKAAVFVLPPGRRLDRPHARAKQTASPIEWAVVWCRAKGIRNALLTNGENWTWVDAPEGGVSGNITWYARLWWLEPVVLRSFYTFLRARALFGPESATLPGLIDRSLEFRDEVAATLGDQVGRAVEVLVKALDRANRDRRGLLLAGVSERELYEAGLTVMMRLVFALGAEERGLLLLGDPVWDGFYAVSTLRAQLEEVGDRDGHGVLERRHDAWSRLLAVFRAIYGGIEHDSLRLPALGGSLFDPDRFPFLEGRLPDTSWRDTPAEPLPIDNRTVLLLLDALQRLARKGGAQVLSYRALDVEQIGHVYEGLLERTVSRAEEATLGLKGAGKAKNADIPLARLESARLDGPDRLAEVLKSEAGISEAVVRRALSPEVPDVLRRRLVRACEGDQELANRILPFAKLLRTDPWDEPVVYLADAFAVTSGSDRSETGAHYTPKLLTERIVGATLEPLAYVGPSDGLPREEWRLKGAAEILDLKVCDPAMGSGAFLVQACRWLAERLSQAWLDAETSGMSVDSNGEVVPALEDREPLPANPSERLLLARRLVAERCLYGVDVNPVAVELAKLSIWLVTLAKNRPFGFLDHNLRHGNSLLGIRDLAQLTGLSMDPKLDTTQRIFAGDVRRAVDQAVALRTRLRATPIRDIRDIEAMAQLDDEASAVLERPELAADALIGEALRNAGSAKTLAAALNVLAREVDAMLAGDAEGENVVKSRADTALAVDLPYRREPRSPFHWPLEYPEVFLRENGGFDAFVGNPPFLGGQKITGAMGTAFRNYLVHFVADGNRGSADIVAYFFLSCFGMLRNGGTTGLLAVNTIAEGDTRDVGLTRLLNEDATIFEAHPNEPWPGVAAVSTSRIHMFKGDWQGQRVLAGESVDVISSFLTSEDDKKALPLSANSGRSFQGSITLGMGFVLTPEAAQTLLQLDSKNADVVFPYLIGDDITSHPQQAASRWVINFWDWPLGRHADGVWKGSNVRQQRMWLRSGNVPSDFPGKVAEEYPDVIAVLARDVKPERQRLKANGAFALRSPLPEKWWIHAEKRPGLYHAIGRGQYFWIHPDGWTENSIPAEVLCFATGATKYPLFEFCSNDQIFANTLGIIALFDMAHYAVLNSAFHTVWSWKYSSSLETRMRYTPTDCFETFPFPYVEEGDDLSTLGKRLKKYRKRGHEAFDSGLTDLYNRFHDPDENALEIVSLREIHVAIDERIKALYSFDDIALEYSFQDVAYLPAGDRTRYTVSEKARLEILRRLARLNQERFEAEQASISLRTKSKVKATGKRQGGIREAPLFTSASPVSSAPSDGEKSVLAVLSRDQRWFGEDEILRETRLSSEAWKETIDQLVESGVVEQEGKMYRLEIRHSIEGHGR